MHVADRPDRLANPLLIFAKAPFLPDTYLLRLLRSIPEEVSWPVRAYSKRIYPHVPCLYNIVQEMELYQLGGVNYGSYNGGGGV